MMKHKVLLLDADGVLVIPPKLFSQVYCENYNIDSEKLQSFYSSHEFKQSILGNMDLVEAIKLHNDLWQWKGDYQDLIDQWLFTENFPSVELLELVAKYRTNGLPIFLATQQESHRAKYLANDMFANYVDGIFSTSDIHFSKDDKNYWNIVISSLIEKYPSLIASEIVFFDDRQAIVDIASECGIDAYLYANVSDVSDNIKL